MTPEVVSLVADALRDDVLGVNAQLRVAKGIGLHNAPPAVARVYSAVDDDAVVLDQALGQWPALVVLDQSPMEVDGEVTNTTREGSVGIGVAYVTGDTGNPAQAYTHAGQTLRAALRAVADVLLDDATLGAENAHGVALLTCERASIQSVREAAKVGMIAGALFLQLRVRDVAPTRAQLLALEP